MRYKSYGANNNHRVKHINSVRDFTEIIKWRILKIDKR